MYFTFRIGAAFETEVVDAAFLGHFCAFLAFDTTSSTVLVTGRSSRWRCWCFLLGTGRLFGWILDVVHGSRWRCCFLVAWCHWENKKWVINCVQTKSMMSGYNVSEKVRRRKGPFVTTAWNAPGVSRKIRRIESQAQINNDHNRRTATVRTLVLEKMMVLLLKKALDSKMLEKYL